MWIERRGTGPEVLLIAGLGDPAEVWQFQLEALADRYRLTAFDNRGAGRTPLPAEPFTVATMADDAAALLRALKIPSAHVAGFSGGSTIAQELALRHPELIRSLVLDSTWARPDAYFRATLTFWRWLAGAAPSERAFLEAFYLWIYIPRAHADGTVEKITEEVLAFPHKPSTEAIQRSIDAFLAHDTAERLAHITAPTLVLAGGRRMRRPASGLFAVARATTTGWLPRRGHRTGRLRRPMRRPIRARRPGAAAPAARQAPGRCHALPARARTPVRPRRPPPRQPTGGPVPKARPERLGQAPRARPPRPRHHAAATPRQQPVSPALFPPGRQCAPVQSIRAHQMITTRPAGRQRWRSVAPGIAGRCSGGQRTGSCWAPGGLLCGSGALDLAARATAAPITMVMVAARESQ
jgi:pimeloyl-ACP methyl ester carboxylesterase